jgi:ATP-binding cassette subfamily B protein RaxB
MELIYSGKRATPFVRQTEASECGLACVAMIAGYHGDHTDLSELRRRFPVSLKGTSLKTLISVADRLGFAARPIRMEMQDFADLTLPSIVHWDLKHFVVVTRVRKGRQGLLFTVHNPATGICCLRQEEVSKHFSGIVLELTPTGAFQPIGRAPRLQIRQLWSKASGFASSLVQLFTLSIILQLIVLGMPLLMQTAVDSVLPSFDRDFLLVLVGGFLGLVIIRAACEGVRGYVILNVGNALSYQIVVNLFRHLMRLPLPWFEKRHVGDIVSRFNSTQPVTTLLTSGLLSSVIDGALAVITLAIMLTYSVSLSLVAVSAIALLTTAQVAYYRLLRTLNASSIAAQAAEQSSFIESIRGIAALKAFGLESTRQRVWQNKKADAVNATLALGRLSNVLSAAKALILGVETVVFVYIAIRAAFRAELTIGMIFAFQAYKQQFIDAGARLVQTYTDYRLLDVHLSRISDIAFTRPESNARSSFDQPPIEGALELRGVRFSYGVGEPDILRGVNFRIDKGESVALIGPSGGGKTTLIKVMMGLSVPNFGEVLVDGQNLTVYSRDHYRNNIGSVAQDDSLFAGTIAENIAFFDPDLDMDRIRAVATIAAIDGDINSMPMKYESLVGDMGSALSGGQKQRVLLARALYRRPSILFLDEGTAHLDQRTEALVNDAVKQLAITRVIVAHRRETIATADRVFLVQDSQVVELPKVAKPTCDQSGRDVNMSLPSTVD